MTGCGHNQIVLEDRNNWNSISMKRYKRAAKMVVAAKRSRKSASTSDETSNEDPYADGDDEVADPTFIQPVPRESSGSQKCEYICCTSEVFGACNKCNSSLCWDHFDDFDSFNNCSLHLSAADKLSSEDMPMFSDTTLTEQYHHFDETLIINEFHEISADSTLTELHAVSADSLSGVCEYQEAMTPQHYEFENCSADVFSTCSECQAFLCMIHYEKWWADSNCSLHKSFVSESLGKENTFTTATTAVQSESSNNAVGPATSSTQHCEFSNCSADISSTCTQCQAFLCMIHFEQWLTNSDCLLHKPLALESVDKEYTVRTMNREVRLTMCNLNAMIIQDRLRVLLNTASSWIVLQTFLPPCTQCRAFLCMIHFE